MGHPHVTDPRRLAQSINEVGAMFLISVLFALSLIFVVPIKAAGSGQSRRDRLFPRLPFAALLLIPVAYVVWSAFQVLG
jgi:hypothetical protein